MGIKGALLAGVCEFMASFLYMSMGCMGTVTEIPLYGSNYFHLSLNFGAAVTVVYECFAYCSGGYINPCVTIAAMIVRKVDIITGIIMIIFQFIGAFAGMGFTKLILPPIFAAFNVCQTVPNFVLKDYQAVGVEFCMTATWVLAMCSIWDKRADRYRESVSLRLGMVVGCATYVGYVLTGSSMNPARTLAPAVIYGKFNKIWVYFAGPLLAAVTMPFAWMFAFTPSEGGGMSDDAP